MARVHIVGAGPAGLRCAEHLVRVGQDVCVIGEKPGLLNNRVAFDGCDADESTDDPAAGLQRAAHRAGHL